MEIPRWGPGGLFGSAPPWLGEEPGLGCTRPQTMGWGHILPPFPTPVLNVKRGLRCSWVFEVLLFLYDRRKCGRTKLFLKKALLLIFVFNRCIYDCQREGGPVPGAGVNQGVQGQTHWCKLIFHREGDAGPAPGGQNLPLSCVRFILPMFFWFFYTVKC